MSQHNTLHFYADSEQSTDGDDNIEAFKKQKQVKAKNKNNHSKAKSSLCRNFSQKGFCPYGSKCQFAHGIQELRFNSDESVYRTKLCVAFTKKNYCVYGPRCNYLHLETEDHSKTRKIVPKSYRQVLNEGQKRERSRLLSILEQKIQGQNQNSFQY